MDDLISRQAAIDGKICIQRSNGVEIYDDYAVPVEYLEQLPPAQLSTNLAEVGTDAISRADAIKIVQNRCKRLTTGCVLAVTEIRNLPPIQPKRGKWIYQNGMINCDQCLRTIRRIDHDGLLNFCPNCGANMREVTE